MTIPPMPSGLTFEQWRTLLWHKEGCGERYVDFERKRILQKGGAK